MAEYHYETDTRKYFAKLGGLKKDLMGSFGDFNSKGISEQVTLHEV